MSYEWTKGTRFRADADKVGEELSKLPQVSIDSVLDKAKDNSSELNKCFTWDNTIAAEAFRRHEASKLISSIKYVVHEPDVQEPERIVIPAYSSVKEEEGEKAKFVFTKTALKDPDLTSQILKGIERDIDRLQDRLRTYKDILTPEILAKIKNLV